MSIDPVTDELRRTQEHPFATRPLGGLDENFQPIQEQTELADAIRIAVEINFRRARNAGTQGLREANHLCLQFWRDSATEKVEIWKNARDAALDIFGNPPRTNIVLARMWDWQVYRSLPRGYMLPCGGRYYRKTEQRKQPKPCGLAQSELREALEEAWTGMVLGDPGREKDYGSVFTTSSKATPKSDKVGA